MREKSVGEALLRSAIAIQLPPESPYYLLSTKAGPSEFYSLRSLVVPLSLH